MEWPPCSFREDELLQQYSSLCWQTLKGGCQHLTDLLLIHSDCQGLDSMFNAKFRRWEKETLNSFEV